MIKHFSGVIATWSGTVGCVGAVSPDAVEGLVRGVIVCPSASFGGFHTYPLAARFIPSGEEWAPVIRFERIEIKGAGDIYTIPFIVEVGADGIP